MSGLDWHPRYHRAALDGMRPLSLEERGAYNTLLDLIYDRGAPVPDDERWLAGWMGCSVRRWNVLRQALLDAGKIEVVGAGKDACLTNSRALSELENQSVRRRKNAENGAKGGKSSRQARAEALENNDLAEACAQANLKRETETVTDTEERTPVVPKGTPELSLISDEPEPEDLFAKAWSIFPDVGRRRSSRAKSKAAWPAAAKTAGGGARLLAAVEAFAASPEATKDAGQFVKAFDRWLRDGRFEHWLPAAVPPAPIGDAPSPWIARCREFSRNGYWNTTDWGPKPGKPGCPAPAEQLEQFGLPPTPNADVLPMRRAAG